MKKILIIGLLLFNVTTLLLAENKELSIGVGMSENINKFYKKERKIIPIPIIEAKYKNIYLNETYLGIDVIKKSKFSSSFFIDLMDGYSVKRKDMDKGYQSINKRKNQVAGGVKLTYNFDQTFQGDISIQYGEHGSKSNLKFSKLYPINEKLYLMAIVGGNYYSNDYSDYYWGVDKDELGGKISKSFTPKDIYSVNLDFIMEYYIKPNFSIISFLSFEEFSSKIKDSPIIENSYLLNMGVGMKYYL